MTRTIKVPLREESSPLSTERLTARGRRSAPSSAKTKRSGTPVRRKSGSQTRSRRQSVTDLSIAPLGDEGDSDEWTGKKRSPRKKRPLRSQRSQSEQSDDVAVDGDEEPAADRGRSLMDKPGTNALFEIYQDEEIANEAENQLPEDEPSPAPSKSPELREIDLNRVSVRQRAPSTKRREGRSEWSDKIYGSEIGLDTASQSNRKVSANSAASYPTPSPTSSYHGSDEVEKTTELPPEEHEHYDTIMESEGFTMIDLDTIPSARNFRTSPEEQKQDSTKQSSGISDTPKKDATTPHSKTLTALSSQKRPTPIPSYLATADDESELSSNVPSSPPPVPDTSLLALPTQPLRSSGRKVTPQTYSSPSLPPPPPVQKPSSNNTRRESPPRKVVDAGMALQGAVSSPDESDSTTSQSEASQTPELGKHDFFGGFSSGTKRELRAGLRFGEELAKHQRPSPLSSQAANKESANSRTASLDKSNIQIKPQVTTQVWRGEAVVQHSPFAADSYPQAKKNDYKHLSEGRMDNNSLLSSELDATKTSSQAETFSSQTPKTSLTEIDTAQLNTTAKREHDWQLEREAVSREIDTASPSKVIVVDSDDDEGVSDTGRSSSMGRAAASKEAGQAKGRRRQNPQETGHLAAEGRRAGQARREARRQGEEARDEQEGVLRPVRDLEEQTQAPQAVEVDDDEDEEDIWVQEAKDNSSSPRDQDTAGMFSRTEQQRQRERAAEVINKPRRSLIPSPWKRGEDVAEASILMSDGAMSGIFWHQPPPPQEAIKFGAGEIARQKRQLSGNFDLETMLSSPVKLAAVGRKNLTLRKSEEHESRKRSSSDEVEEDEVEDESQADVTSDREESEQDVSDAAESQSSSASSPLPPQTVPVNFNDSTLSAVATPPRQMRPSPTEVAERARLTPPRSAMKGARLSFSPPKQEVPSEVRRVVFNERSLYLNSDGEENSMSANLDSPLPEPKPAHQLQPEALKEAKEAANDDEEEEEEEQEEHGSAKQNRRSSWLTWMWRGKADDSACTLEERTASIPKVDGSDEAQADFEVEVDEVDEEEEVAEESDIWQSTKTALPTGNGTNTTPRVRVNQRPSYSPSRDDEPQTRHQLHPQPQPSHPTMNGTHDHTSTKHTKPANASSTQPKPTSKLPSYLEPPSYPSDPLRNPSIPLSTSGAFTNTHFRTLHILHAKSQRPRFHAPRKIRRSIREMIGWKMEVDETKTLDPPRSGNMDSRNGQGTGAFFEWTLGEREAQVLERFMQEIEFGYVVAGPENGGVRAGEKVKWGWSVRELAGRLGMVVVGEAVRAEEGVRERE